MIAALALTTVLVPQGPISSGNLLHAPATVFVDPATAEANEMGDQSAGHYRAAGHQVDPPIHYTVLADRPDFSPSAPWQAPGVTIDAFSTNVNWIAAQGGTASALGVGPGWAGLVVSPTRYAVPTGARMLQEQNGLAGDLYQFMFDDSMELSTGLRGETHRIVDSTEMSVAPPPGQAEADIVALDLFVPYLLVPNHVFPDLHQDFEGVVFSVSSNTIDNVPAHWWLQGEMEVPQSGAVLFVSWWQNQSWTEPTVFLRPWQLNLTNADDVTAVAWDSIRQRLLFSSTKPFADPIQFLNLATSLIPVPLVNVSQQPVIQHIGLSATPNAPANARVAVVGALCAIDPRIRDLRAALGTMVNGSPEPAHTSVFRTNIWGTQGDEFTSALSAPLTKLSAVPGMAALHLTTPFGSPVLAVLPYKDKPVKYTWPAFRGPLLGQPAEVRWVIHDALGATIAATPPAAIRF